VWTARGWRFFAPAEGMTFRLRASGVRVERGAEAWSDGTVIATAVAIGGDQILGPRLSGITTPVGGDTMDIEARAAISAILVALRTHGLISSQKK
jgi:hypothetical protein